jgi:putative FmdB family regulatory protein
VLLHPPRVGCCRSDALVPPLFSGLIKATCVRLFAVKSPPFEFRSTFFSIWGSQIGRGTMPIYEFQCQACGHGLEVLQKISAEPPRDCPSCGESELKKKVSAAAFRLKGSGWYETDFKTGGKKNIAGDKAAPSSEAAGKDSSSGGESGASSSGSSSGESSKSTSSTDSSGNSTATG